jgi:titin
MILIFRFECQAAAEPPPTLKWYHNGLEVTSTKRINVTLIPEKFTTCLTIQNVTLEDTGEYVCKASNDLGESTTKTFLRIRSKSPCSSLFQH